MVEPYSPSRTAEGRLGAALSRLGVQRGDGLRLGIHEPCSGRLRVSQSARALCDRRSVRQNLATTNYRRSDLGGSRAPVRGRSQRVFLETLRVAQALRPKARWGFYGHPAKPGKGGYGGSNGDAYRARNNRYQWMWDAGAVAMPELYLDRTKCTPEECGAWVRGMLNETERLLNASLAIQPRPSTVPFTWYYNGTTKAYLSTEYLKVQALVPFEYRDVDAILVWGDIYVEGHHSVEPLKAYAASTYLPMAKSFQAGQCACATKLCSGNGRCYANATACSCDVGWSGVDCSKPTATPPALSAGAAGSPLSSPPSSFSSRHNVVNVTCPDGLNVCPAGTTCGQMHTGRWGCCEYSEAVICGDLLSCCPSGTTCNTTESRGAVPQGTCSTS